MANDDIRYLTDKEIIDDGEGGKIIDLGKVKRHKPIEIQFQAKNDEMMQEYSIAKEPYCKNCALRNFNDEIEAKRRFIKEFKGDILPAEKVAIKIGTRDLSMYGKETFKYIGTKPIFEKMVVDGMPVQKRTSKWMEYKCKVCNSASSIQVDLNFELDKVFQEKPKKQKQQLKPVKTEQQVTNAPSANPVTQDSEELEENAFPDEAEIID